MQRGGLKKQETPGWIMEESGKSVSPDSSEYPQAEGRSTRTWGRQRALALPFPCFINITLRLDSHAEDIYQTR
jgi:hypothetical protein